MKLCDYGCGQEATHQFKNGKWCCSKNITSCVAIRKKLSIKKAKDNHPMYGKTGKQSPLYGVKRSKKPKNYKVKKQLNDIKIKMKEKTRV